MAETFPITKPVPKDQEQVKVDSATRRAAADIQLPDKVHTWPYLVRAEFISGCVMILGLLIWSIVIDAPLEEPSNPTKTPNPSKAPWYFLGLQEMLVYFDPWIAGVILPTLIIIGLMAIPYIDINPNGNGYYTFKERPMAVSTFLLGFLGLWVGFIIIGVFFRGPGWNLYWPWHFWDPHKVVPMTNRDLPYMLGVRDETLTFIVGAVAIVAWFSLAPLVYVWKRDHPMMRKLGAVRYFVVAFLYLCMGGTVVKILLRHLLAVKYIWVWPNVLNI
jgi:hypothetical protein